MAGATSGPQRPIRRASTGGRSYTSASTNSSTPTARPSNRTLQTGSSNANSARSKNLNNSNHSQGSRNSGRSRSSSARRYSNDDDQDAVSLSSHSTAASTLSTHTSRMGKTTTSKPIISVSTSTITTYKHDDYDKDHKNTPKMKKARSPPPSPSLTRKHQQKPKSPLPPLASKKNIKPNSLVPYSKGTVTSKSSTATTATPTTTAKQVPSFSPRRRGSTGSAFFPAKDESSAPIKITSPHDIFKPGDRVTCCIRKANAKQDTGIKMEELDGTYYIRKATGLVKERNIPITPGDEIVSLNGKTPQEWKNINNMKLELRRKKMIELCVIRCKPGGYRFVNKSIRKKKEQQKLLLLTNGPTPVNVDRDRDDTTTIKKPKVLAITNGEINENSAHTEDSDPTEVYNDFDDDDSDMPSLSSESVILINDGDVMEVVGLKKRTDLNGKIVDVMYIDVHSESPRWICQVRENDANVDDDDGEIVSIAANNLKLPPDEYLNETNDSDDDDNDDDDRQTTKKPPRRRNISHDEDYDSDEDHDDFDQDPDDMKEDPSIVQLTHKDRQRSARSLDGSCGTYDTFSEQDGGFNEDSSTIGGSIQFLGKKADNEDDDTFQGSLRTMSTYQSVITNVSDFRVYPGDQLRLRRLREKAKLNGSLVRVLERDSAANNQDDDDTSVVVEKWKVLVIDTNDVLTVGKKNLRPDM